MKDYYIKTENLQSVLEQLEIELEGNYFQNNDMIVDFIGKIPEIVNEEGEVTSWKTGEHLNIRTTSPFIYTDEKIEALSNVIFNSPPVPYRMFGTDVEPETPVI